MTLSFQQQRLAEQIRAIEEVGGAPTDVNVSSSGRDFLAWLQERSRVQARLPFYSSAIAQGPRLFNRCLLVLLVIAAIAGAITSAKALSAAGTQLNIFWVLGVLLGLSWLSLLLWLLTLFFGNDQLGMLGALFNKVLDHFMPPRATPTSTQNASRIWFIYTFSGSAGRWRLGWITHLLWSLYLTGGLLGLLLLFATSLFDFVWESTLLGGDSFIGFTQILSAPLHSLNLPTPENTHVLASQIDTANQDAANTRRTWALFLLSCVIVYGLLPRLLFVAICRVIELRVRAQHRLDLNLPYYIRLQREFWPQASSSRVVDADVQKPIQNIASVAASAKLPAEVFWLGLELPPTFGLPPAAQQQKQFINIMGAADMARAQALLQQNSAPTALLVDGNKAADRGLQRSVLEVVAAAGAANCWLVLQPTPAPAKMQSWLHTAARAGLTPEQVTCL